MSRTIDELNEDISSVRAVIHAAEKGQSYTTGLAQAKIMASLNVLYSLETQLLDERGILLSGGDVGAHISAGSSGKLYSKG